MKMRFPRFISSARFAAVCLSACAMAATDPIQPDQPAPPAAATAPAPPAAVSAPEVLRLVTMDGRTFLGVAVLEMDEERSKALKLKEEYGVEITRVEDESPAAKAGLRVGDVVLEYNGQRVEGTEQFVRLVRETPSGRSVKLLISRNGVNQTLAATVATRKTKGLMPMVPMEGFRVEMPAPEMSMPDIPKAMMSWRSSLLGVEAESLADSQLASFFGVKEGVLVRSVMKGTTAEKAGIRAGDVILKVDESKVTSPRDVTGAVRSARANSRKNLMIVLMRERKEMSLNVNLDDEAAPTAAPRPAQRISDKPHRQ